MNQLNTWRELIRERQEKLQAKFDVVPKIYWEILDYANIHSKEEVLLKYPEYGEFINSITFNSMKTFTYPGYMSQEAEKFFEGHIIREERDGCAVVGFFVKLADGTITLPSKGDEFIKNEKGILKN